jgi:hypothetical protein
MDLEKKILRLNYYAFLLHIASAIAIGIYFALASGKINFNTTFYTYKITGISGNRDQDLTFSFGEENPKLSLSDIDLKFLVVFIFLITALFHYFYYNSKKYVNEIRTGKNRYRWLEYAITATLMIFTLGAISGVKELYVIILVCVVNILMMTFGYFLEMSSNKQVKTVALVFGFFALVSIFAIFLANFYPNVKSADDLGRKVPSWVQIVLLPMISWWALFGVVAALNSKSYGKKGYNFLKYERYYILLSYFSKAFMGYYLAYGLTRPKADLKNP